MMFGPPTMPGQAAAPEGGPAIVSSEEGPELSGRYPELVKAIKGETLECLPEDSKLKVSVEVTPRGDGEGYRATLSGLEPDIDGVGSCIKAALGGMEIKQFEAPTDGPTRVELELIERDREDAK